MKTDVFLQQAKDDQEPEPSYSNVDTNMSPLRTLYEGLNKRNPRLKEHGFDAFKSDMQDEANLQKLFNGVSAKNPQLMEYGYDAFKTDMFPEPVSEPPIQGLEEAQQKFNKNPRAVMGMDVDTAKQVVGNVANKNIKEKQNTFTGDKDFLVDDIGNKIATIDTSIKSRIQNEGPLKKTFAGKVDDTEYLAKNLYERSLRHAQAVSGDGGTGVGDALKDRNFWTLGATDLTTTIKLKEIAKKIDNNEQLDSPELMLLDAWHSNEQVNRAYPIQDARQGYQVGKSVADMIPWLAQYAATRGAGTGLRTAVTKSLTTGAEKYLGKKFSRMAAKAAGEVVGAYGASALMPQTYSEIGQRSLGDTKKDSNGNIVFDQSTAEKPIEAIYKGWTSNALEVLTERLGEGIQGTKAYQRLPKAKIAERLFGEAGQRAAQRLGQFTKAVGWNGAPLEYLEEWVNIPANAILVGDSDFKDMFDGQQQLTTFLTVLAMGKAMGVANTTVAAVDSYLSNSIKDKEDEAALKLYNEKVPESVRDQLSNIIDNPDLSIEQQGRYLFEVIDGLDNNESKGAILNYIVTLNRWNKANEETQANFDPEQPTPTVDPEQQVDAMRNQFMQESEQQADLFQHENGSFVQVTDKSGKQYVVTKGELESKDGLLFAINEEGKEVQLSNTDIAQSEIIPGREDFIAQRMQAFESELKKRDLTPPFSDQMQELEGGVIGQSINRPENRKSKVLINEHDESEHFVNDKYTFDKEDDGSYIVNFNEGVDPIEAEKEIRTTLPEEPDRFELIQEEYEVPGKYAWNTPEKKFVTKGIRVLPEGGKTKTNVNASNPNVQTGQINDNGNSNVFVAKNSEKDSPSYVSVSADNEFEESLEISAEEVRKIFEKNEPTNKVEGESYKQIKPNKQFDDQVEPNPSLKPQDEIYELLKDEWFANKDEEVVLANIDTRMFQKQIKDTFKPGNKQDAQNWQEIDKAIHLYLDIKEKADQVDRYWEELSDSQKRLVNVASNLTPEQKAIAQEIRKQYDEIGQRALDAEIIHNVQDNYVSRTWDTKGKETDDFFANFSTETGHAKSRTLGSILEGWAKGYELITEGATNNLDNLRVEINNVIENKKLINLALKTETSEGLPILSTQQIPGYKMIEHPNFTKWRKVKQVGAHKEYKGENFVITKDGVVFEKKKLFATPKTARNLNNILNKSTLSKRLPGVGTITRINAQLKASILSWSFFHHMAFTRSYLLGSALGWNTKNWSPIRAYKEGLQMLNAKNPEVLHLVRNGLTLGRNQEWDESAIDRKSKINKWLDKMNVVPNVREKIYVLHKNHADFLFNKYGTGLKVKSAMLEYKHLLEKYPEKDSDYLAKLVAKQTNADFGGLHLERMGRNKNWQHFMRLTLLAPDWTESNVQTMVKAIAAKDKIERRMYQRFWKRALLRTAFTSVALNLALALSSFWDEDEEKGYWDVVTNIYKKAFEDPERLNWLSVNITPLYQLFSEPDGDSEEEVDKYFSVLGHFYDPVKFILAPFQSLKNKGSVLTKTTFEALTGENWQGKRFTTLGELTGTDDKGRYKTSSKKHGYRVGDPKGGMHKGHLTRWRRSGDYGSLKYEEIPSFLLNTIRGSVPIPLQNGLAYALGEISAFDALSHGVGIHLKSKRSYNSLEKEYQEAIEEAILFDRMIKDRMRHGEREEVDKLMADSEKVRRSFTLVKYDKQVQRLKEALLRYEDAGDEKGVETVNKELDKLMLESIQLANKK